MLTYSAKRRSNTKKTKQENSRNGNTYFVFGMMWHTR